MVLMTLLGAMARTSTQFTNEVVAIGCTKASYEFVSLISSDPLYLYVGGGQTQLS